ncbi:MAG TPA: hypothetical protein ENI95_02605 [Chloroflexi bacterium]|nr:hypothetical protein [Chloroflexota bacterium]
MSAPPPPGEKLGYVLEAVRQVVNDFMRRRNVVACGVGYKIKGQQQTGELCVMVSVTRKKPPEELSPQDLIPPRVDDILTDVVETGSIVPLGLNRHVALRPARPGVSIGHEEGTAGTLGCLVRRDERLFMLSNNHVLALLNRGTPGDPILQPGPSDGGTLLDMIGELAEFVPLQFLDEKPPDEATSPAQEQQGCAAWLASLLSLLQTPQTAKPVPLPGPGNVDAALARPLDDSLVDPRIVDIDGPPLGIVKPALGLKVIKSGRTTGLTEGVISQVDVTVDVTYADRVARFTGQFMISPLTSASNTGFSQRGDSGSLVLDYERNAVGLLFSGSEVVSVATPIQTVLSALQVELVTG